jgi:hypothetical protein
MLDHDLYPVAAEMARNGAGRGMIIHRLREANMDEDSAVEVADRALGAVAKDKRKQGLGLAMIGVLTLAIAGFAATVPLVKISVVTGMLGVIVFGLGIANVIRPT